MAQKLLQMLLVDDSPSDVRLMQEALKGDPGHFDITLASDGVEASKYLERVKLGQVQQPDIVILDLNLPRKSGREVLLEMKSSSSLRHIPVVIMTTSNADEDVNQAYILNANCYITKPDTLSEYMKVVHAIEEFWCCTATLPDNAAHAVIDAPLRARSAGM